MVACTSLGSAATRSQGRILAGLDDCDATIYPTTTIIHPCIFLCVSLLSYLPSLLAFPVASRFPVLGSDPPSWVHRTIPESGYSMPVSWWVAWTTQSIRDIRFNIFPRPNPLAAADANNSKPKFFLHSFRRDQTL